MINRILETIRDHKEKHPDLSLEGLIIYMCPEDYERTKALLDGVHGRISDKLFWQRILILSDEELGSGEIRVGGKKTSQI